MKTKNLLLLAAATLVVAVTFTVVANGALLSPRASGNQIKTVVSAPPAAPTIAVATPPVLSPRAAGNQIKVVASTPPAAPILTVAIPTQFLSPRAAGNVIVHAHGIDAVTVRCTAIGTPKYAAMMGNNAQAACCNLTLAECPMMHGCTK